MQLRTMNDLFLHGLQDIYMAEKKILQALPKMAKNAEGSELKQAFQKHQKETEGHVKRLENVFEIIGQKAKGVKCKAIEGIIEEAKEQMEEIEDAEVCDAAILASAQAVEHYEITRYGTLCAWAEELGHDDAVDLLQQTLEEEKKTDHLLSEIAMSKVNKKAA
jgi:ferritin-like metal-binding protein YciE